MNCLFRSLLLTFLFCFSGKLISQELALEMDRVYGLDPLLYNGKKYSYFLPSGTGGNQFLSSEDFSKGDLVIRGIRYSGVSLNYDIYNQQLLLQYEDETGASCIIEIPEGWLESFHLGDLEFKLLDFGNDPRFYQVLGDGPYFILYYLKKDLELDILQGATNYNFTPVIKNQYVLTGDKLLPFRNKKSMVSLFDPAKKPVIKNYMKNNRINLKKASGKTMTELINYISNLN